ncbi:hypothetical protein ACLIA0_14830 [Bacillaceae bacterium W0354]
MSKILEQIPLSHEQDQRISGEKARRFARIRNLEKQLQREKALLMKDLSEEEVNLVEEILNDNIIDDVPKYMSVAEVALITGLSPQMVRRNCANGKYEAFQPSGSNGIWFIKSDTFRKDSRMWKEFIQRRNELFAKSNEVARDAITLQDETLKDIEEE